MSSDLGTKNLRLRNCFWIMLTSKFGANCSRVEVVNGCLYSYPLVPPRDLIYSRAHCAGLRDISGDSKHKLTGYITIQSIPRENP